MKHLFEPVQFGTLCIKNRLIRSATLENACYTGGLIQPALTDVYVELAKGGVGLIISGMMGVWYNSCVRDDMARMYVPNFAEGLCQVVEAAHKYNSKLIVQLGHCGVKSGYIDEGEAPYGPSEFCMHEHRSVAMTGEQIKELIQAYGRAALLCRNTGVDGVEIHAAHGYLLSQFLSPYFNKREDEYGGPLENRARLLIEVYEEIRKKVGKNYPVLVKINASDLVENGMDTESCAWVCQELANRGIDGIEVSSGISMNRESSSTPVGRKDQGYNLEGALKISEKIVVPIISVGGYRSLEFAEEALNKGRIEAISMCRPLIHTPQLPKQWMEKGRPTSGCINCNKCFMTKKHGCARKQGEQSLLNP